MAVIWKLLRVGICQCTCFRSCDGQNAAHTFNFQTKQFLKTCRYSMVSVRNLRFDVAGLMEDDKYLGTERGLQIAVVQPSDAGDYRCVARNAYTNQTRHSRTPVRLVVDDRSLAFRYARRIAWKQCARFVLITIQKWAFGLLRTEGRRYCSFGFSLVDLTVVIPVPWFIDHFSRNHFLSLAN